MANLLIEVKFLAYEPTNFPEVGLKIPDEGRIPHLRKKQLSFKGLAALDMNIIFDLMLVVLMNSSRDPG